MLDHPNIVRINECYVEKERIVIITQLCDGGELLDTVVKDGDFSQEDIKKILKSILGAINYCHKNGIVHRDIKPANILLEKSPDGSIDYNTLKIADFGISGQFKPGQMP
jgi:calcium-dependent protein kinase